MGLAISLGRGRRFVTLDAMRGVAAVMVALAHAAEPGMQLGRKPRLDYLAVDLFFLLSGFVLAYANDKRFQAGQTWSTFMKARIKRLAPLYSVGIALGVVALWIRASRGLQAPSLSLGLAANVFGFPNLFSLGPGPVFPLDTPLWSIFFELWVANLIFGLFWRQLRGAVLYGFIGVCAIGLITCDGLYGTANIGWTGSNLWGGFPRVGFSFFAGVALARLHAARPFQIKVPSVAPVLALAAILMAPLPEATTHLFEPVAVLAIFPLLIYAGVDAVEKRPKVGSILGDASYALYTIHYPILLILVALAGGWAPIHKLWAQVAIIAGIFALAAVLARVDEMVRRSNVWARWPSLIWLRSTSEPA